MAEVSLRHIKKVYPNMEKKKKGESDPAVRDSVWPSAVPLSVSRRCF